MSSHITGATNHTQTHFTHQHSNVKWENSQNLSRPNLSSEETNMAEATTIDFEIYLTEKRTIQECLQHLQDYLVLHGKLVCFLSIFCVCFPYLAFWLATRHIQQTAFIFVVCTAGPIKFCPADSDTDPPWGPITDTDHMDWLFISLFRYKCYYLIWQNGTIKFSVFVHSKFTYDIVGFYGIFCL